MISQTLLFIIASSVWQAQNYFIDARMPNDTLDGRTPKQAWKTPRPLRNIKLQQGDSILFRNGGKWSNERFEIHQSGRPGNPISIGSYGPRDLPKPHLIDTSSQVLGIGASYIVVSGLKLSGARRYGISTLGRNRRGLKLIENEITHCTNGILINQADQVTIINNYIHGISYNRSNKGAVGIILDQSASIQLQGNMFRNCIGHHNGVYDGGAIELFRSCNSIAISENKAINAWGFIEMGGLPGDTIRNVRISANTAIDTRSFAWFNLDTPTDTSNFWGVGYDSIRIVDNTLIQNRTHTSNAIGSNGSIAHQNQIIVENNIFAGDSLNDFIYKGNFHLINNIFWSKTKQPKRPFPPTNRFINPRIIVDTNRLIYSTHPDHKSVGSPQSGNLN